MISRCRIQTDLYVKTAMLERNAFAVTSLGGGMAGGQSDRGASTGRTLAPTDERGGLRNRPFARLLALIASWVKETLENR